MKQQILGKEMTKSTIKLNHVCKICQKEIYLPDGTIIHGRPLHFLCWKDECRNSRQAEIIEILTKECYCSDYNPKCMYCFVKEKLQQILEKKK